MSRKRVRAREPRENSSWTSHIRDWAEVWHRERPDLDPNELLLQIYLMRLGRMLETAYDRMCRDRFHIRGAEMRVLFALRRAGAPYTLRPTDLFRALLVTSGAMTKQVDRLVASGHVLRLPDPAYNGGFQIELTRLGIDAANDAVEMLANQSLLKKATSVMSDVDVDEILRSCETMMGALEAHPAPPPERTETSQGRSRK